MRIKVSGELGTAVMSLAVIGLYYGAASFLVENVILRNLTEEERDEHILSKLLFWSTVIYWLPMFCWSFYQPSGCSCCR